MLLNNIPDVRPLDFNPWPLQAKAQIFLVNELNILLI